jgi:hypothetical protein
VTAGTYDPLAYLTSSHVSAANSLVGQYSKALAEAQSEFGAWQSGNIDFLGETYTLFNKYVGELRESVYDSYQDALDQTDMMKNIFVQTGKLTADENKALIGEFSKKLPNSRMGESVNKTVAEFVAAPVAFTNVDIRVPITGVKETEDQRLLHICYICLVAIVISLVAQAVRASRVKRKRGNAH